MNKMGWESTYETLRVDVDFFVDSFVGHLPSYELQWWTAYHAHLPIFPTAGRTPNTCYIDM